MYSVAKAFVAGLAVLGGAKAQQQTQTIYNLNPGDNGVFGIPANCSVQGVFPSDNSWDLSVIPVQSSPQILQIGLSEKTFNYSNSLDNRIWVYNGGNKSEENGALFDCTEGANFLCIPIPGSTILGNNFFNYQTLCGGLDNETEFNCILFKSPDDSSPFESKVRIYTKGYSPDQDGVSADSIVNIQSGVPYNFKLSSNITSDVEIMAIPEIKTQGTVFLSCSQQQSLKQKESHSEFSH
jgi:hypothetical protein